MAFWDVAHGSEESGVVAAEPGGASGATATATAGRAAVVDDMLAFLDDVTGAPPAGAAPAPEVEPLINFDD